MVREIVRAAIKLTKRVPLILGIIILLGLLLSSNYFFDSSFAQKHPALKYFPSNEKITTVNTDNLAGYPFDRYETACNPASLTWGAGGNIIAYQTLCNLCMGWKDGCPNCCIDPSIPDTYCSGTGCTTQSYPFSDNCDGHSRVDCIQCADPTNCGVQPLNTSCATSIVDPGTDDINNNGVADGLEIVNCQRAGCPDSSVEPHASGSDKCVAATDQATYPGSYFCTADDLVPDDRGCVPSNSTWTALGYDASFNSSNSTDDFYDVVTYAAGTCPETAIPGSFDPVNDPCYEYRSDHGVNNPSFYDYVANCPTVADAAEWCAKNEYCCKQSQCQPEGMDLSCDLSIGGGCEQIINNWDVQIEVPQGQFRNCYNTQPQHCVLINDFIQDCMANAASGSDCSVCFDEIDSTGNFFYEFVPKSGESFIVLWAIEAEPHIPVGTPAQYSPYFYTMARVFDANGNEVALSSNVVNQKTFRDSFSINSALSIESSDLQVGQKYFVRLYYLTPDDGQIPAGTHLTMTINRMEMNIFRVRE